MPLSHVSYERKISREKEIKVLFFSLEVEAYQPLGKALEKISFEGLALSLPNQCVTLSFEEAIE